MLKNYVLTAYKVFMRRKLFTAINLLCIVLTLTILLVVTAMLENTLNPGGAEDKSGRFLEVAYMQSTSPDGHRTRSGALGFKLVEHYLKPLKWAQTVATVSLPQAVSIYQDGRIIPLLLRRADAPYWKVLDFKLVAGRVPDQDDVDHARLVAVLNASNAERLFGGAAVGKKLAVGAQSFEIIGVVEDSHSANALADLWAPISTYPSSEYRNQIAGNFVALLLARSAAEMGALRAEVAAVEKTIVFEDPSKWKSAHLRADSKFDAFARGMPGVPEGEAACGAAMGVVAALMFLFMLLPALNLVNLNMGRIMERSAEIGVRKSFGATSAELVRQFVLENILLCLAGGAISLLCAQAFMLWLGASGLIPHFHATVDPAVFAWGLLITVVFGLVSGCLPAWRMARLDPVHALKGIA
ncbi:MAG: ABC transporter permease [Pseudomonadota bacterium]